MHDPNGTTNHIPNQFLPTPPARVVPAMQNVSLLRRVARRVERQLSDSEVKQLRALAGWIETHAHTLPILPPAPPAE